MSSGTTVLVLAGGSAPHDVVPPRHDRVIAADSGLHHAAPLGLTVDVLVGDLDSVRPDALAKARAESVEIVEYPEDKDRTDLALALDLAVAEQPEHVVVVGGGGGRLDHLLANVALLCSEEYASSKLVAYLDGAVITIVRERATIRGTVGDLVSLIPYGGPAAGVTTTGLRWPLTDATLEAGSTWGVSNCFVADRADVSVTSGCLAAVQP